MPKIRFPVIGPKQAKYPKRALCPWCRKRKVWEPHSFAVLSVADYLHLTWHGAHNGGTGSHRDIYETVEIVREIEGEYEEYELYWCSTRCLRSFLNACVDALEERMQRSRSRGCSTKRRRVRGGNR